MRFYETIKTNYAFEKYLELHNFNHRRILTKIRCSDHRLEIEKGRHRKVPREDRICRLCTVNEIETEDHFLNKCKFYDYFKIKYDFCGTNITSEMIENKNLEKIGQYLCDTFTEREKQLESMVNS